ncbi:hypothetical protein PORCAN_778 [Porphyromonas crevioricanis JCM 13913]|nr:hypothetical protein PORCAN_778 [Porphyromonas crevioricanis JCM 13913]
MHSPFCLPCLAQLRDLHTAATAKIEKMKEKTPFFSILFA